MASHHSIKKVSKTDPVYNIKWHDQLLTSSSTNTAQYFCIFSLSQNSYLELIKKPEVLLSQWDVFICTYVVIQICMYFQFRFYCYGKRPDQKQLCERKQLWCCCHLVLGFVAFVLGWWIVFSRFWIFFVWILFWILCACLFVWKLKHESKKVVLPHPQTRTERNGCDHCRLRCLTTETIPHRHTQKLI